MSPRFECARCSVEGSFLPGFERELPTGWASEDGELRCLSCRREIVVERAIEEERRKGTSRRAIGIRVRERALIEFELRRDGGRSDKEISIALKSPTNAVATARRRMREEAAGAEDGRGSDRAASSSDLDRLSEAVRRVR